MRAGGILSTYLAISNAVILAILLLQTALLLHHTKGRSPSSFVLEEEQIFEQTVKVKALAQQLNSIKEFLNEYGAQKKKITMRWQNR